MNCKDMETQAVCLRSEDGKKVSAIAHFEYGASASDAVLKASTRYTDASGDVFYDPADFESIEVGQCNSSENCVESQEWTYGIDNTGTNFRWPSATYEMILSDGSSFQWTQTAAANGGWTPQMEEWGQEIQNAANAAGIKWFVETRFRAPSDPSNLQGGGGFAGPPSLAVSNALTNMLWRYVNIQICPGQPVPVAANLIAVDDAGGQAVPALPYSLTTDGAVLGPIQKFWVCKDCASEPVWYLEDGVTLAEDGQIPNCWEPCGTLALTDAPPDRECQYQTIIGCDSNNSANTVDFTNTITRRATICNGEQITVDYFQEDPADPSALIAYTLQGDFVDCATGEPVPVPAVVCENPQVEKLWRLKTDGQNAINGQRWLANAAPFGSTESAFTDCRTHVNGPADETVVITDNWNLVDTDFPATPGTATSQELYYAWIYLDKPTVLRDTNGSTGEFLTVLMGGCGQKPRAVAAKANTAGGNSNLGEFIELGPGLYQVVFHVNDFSVNGGISLQQSVDGGDTFTAFPMSRTYEKQPEITCDYITICDGVITELDGTVIDFDPDTMSSCEIKCPEVILDSDALPDFEFATVDGCDNFDDDPANFQSVTRETVWTNGVPVSTFYTDYGNDALQAEYEMLGSFVDCASGQPIDDPDPICDRTSYAGVLWRVKDTSQLLTTVDYWGPPALPGGGNSAPHDNVSNIFTSDGTTLVHVNGAPNVTFVATYTDIRTSNANFRADVGAASSAETSGNDQIRVRGYVILNSPVLLRDTNPNTGERGGIWINRCCAGTLDLLFEDTTDSVSGDTGIFDGVRVPAGIHYFEAVTSDLSSWQGFQLSASTDDGANYAPLPIYDIKPEYECIPLVRCDDTGLLLHADTGEEILVGPNDLRCEPPACVADNAASDSSYTGPTAEEIAKANVIAERDSVQGCFQKFTGTNTETLNVPAGQRGNLVAISDTGTGLVYFTINGSTPDNNAGADRGEMSGQYLSAPVRNIDLSALQFNASSGAGDYTVYFEKYS